MAILQSILLKQDTSDVNKVEFSNYDIWQYLNENLTTQVYRTVSGSKLFPCQIHQYDDIYFMLCTNISQIELSFDVANREKMQNIIDVLCKWDKFDRSHDNFLIEIQESLSYSVIFNLDGSLTLDDYKQLLKTDDFTYTKF